MLRQPPLLIEKFHSRGSQIFVSMASRKVRLFGHEDDEGEPSPRKRHRASDDEEDDWVCSNEVIEVVLGARGLCVRFESRVSLI